MPNQNTRKYLDATLDKILCNLDRLVTPGGVQIKVNNATAQEIDFHEMMSERYDSCSVSNIDSNSDLFPFWSSILIFISLIWWFAIFLIVSSLWWSKMKKNKLFSRPLLETEEVLLSGKVFLKINI